MPEPRENNITFVLSIAMIDPHDLPFKIIMPSRGREDLVQRNALFPLLPYGLLEKCVSAWDKIPEIPSVRRTGGFDVADTGTDKSCLTIRRGPRIESVQTWSGVTVDEATRKAHRVMQEKGVEHLFYDATGLGVGVRITLQNIGDYEYFAEPIQFGGPVTGPDKKYSMGVTNKALFGRRAGQLAWALRQRARHTERYLSGEKGIDPEYCLAINPNIPNLEAYLEQLAQPQWKESTTSHIEVDKYGETESSPNMYDGTALAFANDSRNGLFQG